MSNDRKCAICKRTVAVPKDPNGRLEMMVQDTRFFMAWPVHHACISRMWDWAKTQEHPKPSFKGTMGELERLRDTLERK